MILANNKKTIFTKIYSNTYSGSNALARASEQEQWDISQSSLTITNISIVNTDDNNKKVIFGF